MLKTNRIQTISIVTLASLLVCSFLIEAVTESPEAIKLRQQRNSLFKTRNSLNQQQPQSESQPKKQQLNSRSTNKVNERSTANGEQVSGPSSSSSSAAARSIESFTERDELPADFYELPAEQLDLGMNATGRAPIPILNVAVLQYGQVIDNSVTVHPGTPLEMVIYLDDKSAKVYGLLASYLKVQDDTPRQREEVIVSNGCSIDTYIFGNFEHNPDDQSLRAKFRAFKFPESNFVRFVGTVNVCIKQCSKVNCSGNRRRRAINSPPSLSSSLSSENKKANDERLVMTVSTTLRIADPSTSFGQHDTDRRHARLIRQVV